MGQRGLQRTAGAEPAGPKKLVAEGSHMLDPCFEIAGEDEKGYITSILERVATRVPAPILADSTEADVVEEALKRIPGKRPSSIRSIWKMAKSELQKFGPGPDGTALA